MASNSERVYDYAELFDVEITNLKEVAAVSTLTFYDGIPPVEYLQARVAEIVKLNPWLDSRLVTHNGKIVVKYCKEAVEEGAFAVDPESVKWGGSKVTILEPHEVPLKESDYQGHRYHNGLLPFLVKKGGNCYDKDEPLFHVALLKLGEKRFAVMLSISHTLVDGYTYYTLNGMISCDIAPRALILQRERTFMEQVEHRVKVNNDFFTSAGLLCNIVGHVCCGRKEVHSHWFINADTVKDIKQEQKNSDGTVISTNDIIVSSFFINSNCDVGFLPANFRNRIVCASNEHAGNYEGTISYRRPDFASPKLIRQSVGNPVVDGRQIDFDIKHSFRRVVTGDGPFLESFWDRRKARLAIITNWCGFYIPVVLKDCQQTLHIPVIEKGPSTGLAVGILYMAMPDKMAIMTIQPYYCSLVENMMAEHLLGESVK